MSEPTGCAGGCPRIDTYCDRCDLLVGLPGLRVVKVHAEKPRLIVTVESPLSTQGCRGLRGGCEQPRSPERAPGRRPVLWASGTSGVAQADLGV